MPGLSKTVSALEYWSANTRTLRTGFILVCVQCLVIQMNDDKHVGNGYESVMHCGILFNCPITFFMRSG